MQEHNPDRVTSNVVSTLTVLDERSVSEGLCLLLSVATDPGEARCECDLAVEVLVVPQVETGRAERGLGREE